MPSADSLSNIASPRHWNSSRIVFILCAMLILIAFEPVRQNNFVWDDEHNLVSNPQWRGLSQANLHWMWSTFHGGHYQPLTWTSLAIEYHLWNGANPVGIHFTNVLFHIANAGLLFLVIRRLLGFSHDSPVPNKDFFQTSALLGTIFFAMHPLRVESVAWATERRDVLSTFFLLLSTLFYLSAARRNLSGFKNLLSFSIAFLFFCLSLLCKASGMTFPLVLLVLDFYPLRRMSRSYSIAIPHSTTTPLRPFLEKLVFMIPAAFAAAIALLAQRTAGALQEFELHSLGVRIAQAFYGIMFYPIKTLLPYKLSPLYEQDPNATPLDPQNIIALIAFVAVTVTAFRYRTRMPAVITAWLAYLILIAPVLGLAQSGPQLVADRYSYLACIPFAVLLGAAAYRILSRSLHQQRAAPAIHATILAISLLGLLLTRAQVKIWKDNFTLWSRVVAIRPSTGLAHANLAVELNNRGEFDPAIAHARRALEILPGNLAAHTALGRAALARQDWETARNHLIAAIEIREHIRKPDASLHAAAAIALSQLKKTPEAAAQIECAVSLEPENPNMIFDLAGIHAANGNFDAASKLLEDTIARNIATEGIYARLGAIYQTAGAPARAKATYEAGLKQFPGSETLRAALVRTRSATPVAP